jgi:hypothetical protein
VLIPSATEQSILGKVGGRDRLTNKVSGRSGCAYVTNDNVNFDLVK